MKSILAIEQVDVQLNGAPLEEGDCRSLGSIYIRQRLSLPTQCELVFFDPTGSLAQAKRPQLGEDLKVSVVGQPDVLFAGQLTAIEYDYGPDRGRRVYLRAYDRLHRLRKRQHVRSFEKIHIEDLVKQLVAEDDLEVEIGQIENHWPWLIQHRQTDLELLREMTEKSAGYFYLHGSKLKFFDLTGLGEFVKLSLGSNILEASLEVNADKACEVVDAVGWDPVTVGSSSAKTKEAQVGLEVGMRVDQKKTGGSAAYVMLDESASIDSQANAMAQAELNRRTATTFVLRAIAQGDTRLRPGARVEVRGIAENLNGRYVLTDVAHTIDRQRGYLSKIDTEPPPCKPVYRDTIVAFGIVTSVDDPEKLGRVRTRLPAYQDVQTNWMRVVSPGGGDQKGLVALPAVNDHVLILFAHGDPACGVVLGGLFQEQGAFDSGVDGEEVVRYSLKTPKDQLIRLDDAEGQVELENEDGSFIRLSHDRVEIHAERDMIIEAPGRRIKIRGAAIDFERA